jgi:vitamin B12 transporter
MRRSRPISPSSGWTVAAPRPPSIRHSAAWGGATAGFGAQRLQVNLRHDDYSDVGTATTALLAWGVDLSPEWRIAAQAASAFRAPGFNDLYFPGFGNPRLSPERARSGELSLRFQRGTARASLAVFRTRTRDLIAFDFATSQAANIARATAEGVELMLSAPWAGWVWSLDASGTRAIDASTELRLLRRAPHAFHLSAQRSFQLGTAGGFDFGAQVSRIGARYDSDINTFARTRLAPYTLARLTLAWRATPAVTARLRLENAFDRDYELIDGYNTPGRGLFAGLHWRL